MAVALPSYIDVYNNHLHSFYRLSALEKAIEEKEELERLVHSYKSSSSTVGASSTIAFQGLETNSAKNTASHTPLSTDNLPATTPLTYELGGVKLDSHTVNELLEQQVYMSE